MNLAETKGNIFRILYYTNLSLILLVLLVGFFQGLSIQGDGGGTIWLYVFLYAVFIITPLAVPFLLLNVWGAISQSKRRVVYSLIAVALAIWCYFGLAAWAETPLP